MATTKLGSFLAKHSITTRVTSSEFLTTKAWSFERWCRLSNCVAVALLGCDLGLLWPTAKRCYGKRRCEVLAGSLSAEQPTLPLEQSRSVQRSFSNRKLSDRIAKGP